MSCVHKLDQVSRASFSYEFLGRRTWVVYHGLKSLPSKYAMLIILKNLAMNKRMHGPDLP